MPTLILYSPTDLVFYPPFVEKAANEIGGAETAKLTGPNGHFNGVLAIGQAADKISAFLAR